jgi:hypothetical protein
MHREDTKNAKEEKFYNLSVLGAFAVNNSHNIGDLFGFSPCLPGIQ